MLNPTTILAAQKNRKLQIIFVGKSTTLVGKLKNVKILGIL